MAPNAFKVRQFIVLLKTKEADPIRMNILGTANPFKICETEENIF